MSQLANIIKAPSQSSKTTVPHDIKTINQMIIDSNAHEFAGVKTAPKENPFANSHDTRFFTIDSSSTNREQLKTLFLQKAQALLIGTGDLDIDFQANDELVGLRINDSIKAFAIINLKYTGEPRELEIKTVNYAIKKEDDAEQLVKFIFDAYQQFLDNGRLYIKVDPKIKETFEILASKSGHVPSFPRDVTEVEMAPRESKDCLLYGIREAYFDSLQTPRDLKLLRSAMGENVDVERMMINRTLIGNYAKRSNLDIESMRKFIEHYPEHFPMKVHPEQEHQEPLVLESLEGGARKRNDTYTSTKTKVSFKTKDGKKVTRVVYTNKRGTKYVKYNDAMVRLSSLKVV